MGILARMRWTEISSPPEEDGSYIVCAPSEDPRRPLVTMAWFNPSRPAGTMDGWSQLPAVWLRALTHWTHLPTTPYGIRKDALMGYAKVSVPAELIRDALTLPKLTRLWDAEMSANGLDVVFVVDHPAIAPVEPMSTVRPRFSQQPDGSALFVDWGQK